MLERGAYDVFHMFIVVVRDKSGNGKLKKENIMTAHGQFVNCDVFFRRCFSRPNAPVTKLLCVCM